MSFKVLTSGLFQRKVETGSAVRIANERFLGFVTRHGNSGSFAVLIDTSLADNTLDRIPITEGLAQSFEYNAGHTFL